MSSMFPKNLDPSLLVQLSAPIFLIVFAMIIWSVYRRDKRGDYQKHSQIPLGDDEQIIGGE